MLRAGEIDQNGVSLDLSGVGGYGLGGRKVDGLASTYVEARAVQPALDLAALDVALGQRDRRVRALVAKRVDVVAVTYEGDLLTVDLDGEDTPAGTSAQAAAAGRSVIAKTSYVRGQLLFDGGDEALLEGRHTDAADDVVEEAVHDESTCVFLLDATALQVEQVLVVEAAGRRRVSGAFDLTGLDLEVGHRVGLGTVGQHEVVVALVRQDAFGFLADEDVADPDRVSVLALERAFVLDVALGARCRVVDEQAVLDVLALVGEVDAEHLDAAAGADVVGRGAGAYDVTAERDGDVAQRGVTADPGVLGDDVDAVVVPVLDRHERQLRAVLEDDLDVLGPGGGSVVVDDDDGLGELTSAYEEVPCGGLLESPAVQADRGRLGDLGVGRDRHLEHGLRRVPGASRHAVDRDVARDATSRVGSRHRHGAHALSSVDLDLEVVTVERGVLVQATETLERGEPPDLLHARGHGVVGEVERPLRVQM